MSPATDRRFPSRGHALVLALSGLALFGVAAFAAVQPRVENPHGKFREDCQLCHNAKAWNVVKVSSKFDHSKFGFPLEGAHATSDCKQCHKTLDFAQSRPVCASCHQDPHRGEMGTDCARCHGARSFVDRGPMVRAHALTRFPLTGGHAAVDCESCHKPAAQGQMQFVGTTADCKACHMTQYQSAKSPDHVAGGFPTDCQTCHGPTTWANASFNHDRTAFPLTGAHRAAACAQCHTTPDFQAADPACATCHRADYDRATPPHLASGFPASACATCHNTTSFSDATFNHSNTAFPLTGAHTSASCTSCHGDGVYDGRSTACFSCHATDYSSATPTHTATAFPSGACGSCHGTSSWNTTFNHSTTSFPLTGAHTSATCTSCHGDGVYDGKSTACFSCHATEYAAASPPHNPGAFPTGNCGTCHNTSTFSNASFNHGLTSFPLTGAHTSATCTSCHGDGVYDGKSTACFSCHAADYASATPVHTAGSFPTSACASCHGTSTWTTTFNHSTTSFPLTGAHTSATCSSCHGDGVYDGKSTACYSCHATEYATASPPHNPGAFPTGNCGTCHNTTTFTNATFNHSLTAFPLTGAHTSATCTSCHGDGVYDGKSTACYSCHASDYASATPVHTAGSFPTSACASCHGTSTWTTTFNHSATSFPLTGAHTSATCTSCHGDGIYDGKSTACYSCHASDYSGASPPHNPTSFPTASCATCHNTTTFANATFNHGLTAFPLTGAHVAATCTSCHGNGVYAGRSTACYSCHQQDYTSASPPHDTVNYPTAGCVCHNTTTWSGATSFNHTAVGFPLTGQHASPPRDCVDCHSSGYASTSRECYSCHATTYASAVPRHDTAHFPTATSNCITCHAAANTGHVTWTGGRFANHTWFPISSGRHSGIGCMDCHNSPTNLTSYSCARSCHTSELRDHPNRNGFSLTTVETQCYVCHPRGSRG